MERKTHRESWKGEESVKDRFTLPEDKMVPFLTGEYTPEEAREDIAAKVGLKNQSTLLPEQFYSTFLAH